MRLPRTHSLGRRWRRGAAHDALVIVRVLPSVACQYAISARRASSIVIARAAQHRERLRCFDRTLRMFIPTTRII